MPVEAYHLELEMVFRSCRIQGTPLARSAAQLTRIFLLFLPS